METIRKIKVAHDRHETPIRQISKNLNMSRNTVRKVLRSEETRFEYKRAIQPMPKLGEFTTLAGKRVGAGCRASTQTSTHDQGLV